MRDGLCYVTQTQSGKRLVCAATSGVTPPQATQSGMCVTRRRTSRFMLELRLAPPWECRPEG